MFLKNRGCNTIHPEMREKLFTQPGAPRTQKASDISKNSTAEAKIITTENL